VTEINGKEKYKNGSAVRGAVILTLHSSRKDRSPSPLRVLSSYLSIATIHPFTTHTVRGTLIDLARLRSADLARFLQISPLGFGLLLRKGASTNSSSARFELLRFDGVRSECVAVISDSLAIDSTNLLLQIFELNFFFGCRVER
jgi:hypothetical protein